MRFMVMVRSDATMEAGQLPSEDGLAQMAKFNEELVKAGVMLDGAGLKPSAAGARITYRAGAKPVVTDGPFAETKELIAGYWIIQVKSREEAIEWMKRAPFATMADHGGTATVEIRPYYELEDFTPGPAIDHHRQLQEQIDKNNS